MLKSDFKDDIFSGARKYNMITNPDGTVSLADATQYTQEGDYFGANEMNAIADDVNAKEQKLSGISENANSVENSSTNGNILIDGVETKVYTHPSGTNPHNTTKADVGLGNATNESKATMFTNPTFTGTAKATDNTAYTTPQLRNIQASTTDLTPGVSALASGSIYITYE